RIITTCSALLVGALSTSAGAAEPAAEGEVSAGVSLGTRDGASAEGTAEGDANAGGEAAPEGEAATEGEAAPEGDAKAKKTKRRRNSDRADQKWIKRWAPERNMGEIGVFGGVLIPSRRLELFEPDQ